MPFDVRDGKRFCFKSTCFCFFLNYKSGGPEVCETGKTIKPVGRVDTVCVRVFFCDTVVSVDGPQSMTTVFGTKSAFFPGNNVAMVL